MNRCGSLIISSACTAMLASLIRSRSTLPPHRVAQIGLAGLVVVRRVVPEVPVLREARAELRAPAVPALQLAEAAVRVQLAAPLVEWERDGRAPASRALLRVAEVRVEPTSRVLLRALDRDPIVAQQDLDGLPRD